jgi:GTP pyrophosphokinase
MHPKASIGNKSVPDDLFEQLRQKFRLYDQDPVDWAVLEKAYRTASSAHHQQSRASGEKFIVHPLSVALLLAGIKMDVSTIAAAILHDVLEDTGASYMEIADGFGKQVADLVEGVTKLAAISLSKEKSRELKMDKQVVDHQAENLRKIFLAMAKDIRVILIKLADRLNNLKTLDSLPQEKRELISRETLEIFAPIASRLGMWEFKWQLEDLAFSYLEPEEYEELSQKVTQRRREREKQIEELKEILRNSLSSAEMKNFVIEGRPKHFYGIYRKMKEKGRSMDDIYDLLAVRVIVESVPECYQVLGIIHSLWMPFQDRFKDYIAMPKSNNYRSLHTTIYGPGNQPVEVQIRTREMHQIDEYGIAAHWAYKEKRAGTDINLTGEIYPWIRRMLDWHEESRDAREYIENLKLDILQKEVFVFTPKGQVIDLPAGSIPLDFAYRIHTEVGHRFIGAKVNSRIVPLDFKLNNADIVEILTSKQSNPSTGWLKAVRSPHARSKIRQWFRKEKRAEYAVLGREALLQELKKIRIEVALDNSDILNALIEHYKFTAADDLFVSVGYGELTAATVAKKIKSLVSPELPTVPLVSPPPSKKAGQRPSGIGMAGVDNVGVRFARCCSPIFGDEVFGYISLGKGISVHRCDCPNYANLASNPDRVVNVYWVKQEQESTYTVILNIEGLDRPDLLFDVVNAINQARLRIAATKSSTRSGRLNIRVSIDISSREQLENLISGLSRIRDVYRVSRVLSRGK